MQQRFSMNEIKKQGKPAKVMTTSDMLTHPWIITETDGSTKSGTHANKKKSNDLNIVS